MENTIQATCQCGHAADLHTLPGHTCAGEALAGSLSERYAAGWRCDCQGFIPAGSRIEFCPVTGAAMIPWTKGESYADPF